MNFYLVRVSEVLTKPEPFMIPVMVFPVTVPAYVTPWNPADAKERLMLGAVKEPVSVRAAEPADPIMVPLPVTCVPACYRVRVTDPVPRFPFHVP